MTLRVKIAGSWWRQTVGLIGQKKIQPTLFNTHFGIHTFGMRVPLDVLVLDRDQTIVKLKENLPPTRFFFWNLKYNLVLELPAGFICQNNLKVGERLTLVKI